MDLGVLERSPDAGDPGAIDDLVAGYTSRAERFAERSREVRAAGDRLAGSAEGEWAVALHERALRLAAGFDDAADGCRQVADVLAGYAAAVRALKRRVMAARHEVGTARIRAVAARDRYAAVALAAGAPSSWWSWTDVPAFPAVPAAAAELHAWQAAVQDAKAALLALRACCDEREDLDRATAARLVRVHVMATYAPGATVDAVLDVPLVQALASSALGAVTAEQAYVIRVWLRDAVRTVSDHPGDANAVRRLADFFEGRGAGSAAMMATVFAALGGERTAKLVASLGVGSWSPLDRDGSRGHIARGIREALAESSRLWSRAEADEFVDGFFVPGLVIDGTSAKTIDFLFADPDGARMSAAVTVAMADRIDAFERQHGRLPHGSDPHGYRLEAGQSFGTRGHVPLDPAAAVLAMLGTYPDDARNWLTGGPVDWSSPDTPPLFAGERIEYWFGTRNWGAKESDGFEGIAALWAGIQVSPGGAPVNRQVAAINSLVFDDLSGNPSLSPAHVAAPGAVNLAKALAGQLPGLVEVGFQSGFPEERNPQPWTDVTVPYIEDTVVTARLSRDWVRPVLTAAVAHDEARDELHAAALQYQESVLRGVIDGRASAAESLHTLVAVWGGIDGATYSASEGKQYLHDRQVRGVLSAGRTVLDVGAAFSPAGPLTSLGMDVGLNVVQRLAESALTGGPLPESATHSAVPGGVRSLDDFFVVSVNEFRRLGLWDKTSGHAGDFSSQSAESIARDLVADYDDIVGAMRMSASDSLKGDAR